MEAVAQSLFLETSQSDPFGGATWLSRPFHGRRGDISVLRAGVGNRCQLFRERGLRCGTGLAYKVYQERLAVLA